MNETSKVRLEREADKITVLIGCFFNSPLIDKKNPEYWAYLAKLCEARLTIIKTIQEIGE